MENLSQVGGKNASLGEMIKNLSSMGIEVPDGYAITVAAYAEFLSFNAIYSPLRTVLETLDHKTLANLSDVGKRCRDIIMRSEIPDEVKKSIEKTRRSSRSAWAQSFLRHPK